MFKKFKKTTDSNKKEKLLETNLKHVHNVYKVIKKYNNLRVIGGYMPINYEYDCSNLLKFLEIKNYTICLPVIKIILK